MKLYSFDIYDLNLSIMVFSTLIHSELKGDFKQVVVKRHIIKLIYNNILELIITGIVNNFIKLNLFYNVWYSFVNNYLKRWSGTENSFSKALSIAGTSCEILASEEI